VIVLEPIYDAFVQRLVEATRSLNIGAAESPSTQVGPVIDANARDRIREYIEKGRSVATVALEMPAPDTGYFIGPVIFRSIPLLPLLKKKFLAQLWQCYVKDLEAIAVANNTNYALTGGLYSRTPTHIQVAQEQFSGQPILIATSQVRSYPGNLSVGSSSLASALRQEDQTLC